MTLKMAAEKVDTLIHRISEKPSRGWLGRTPHRKFPGLEKKEIVRLRSELHQKFQDAPKEETRRDCLKQLCHWLAITLALHDSEPVQFVTNTEHFVLATLYLDVFIDTWKQDEPSPDERDCVCSTVDLLLLIGAQRERDFSSVQEELVAVFILCCALRGGEMAEYLAKGIKGDVREDLLNRSELYQRLVSSGTGELDEVVRQTRRRYLSEQS